MNKPNENALELKDRRRKLKDFINSTASHYGSLRKSKKTRWIDSAIEIHGLDLMSRDSITRVFRRCLRVDHKVKTESVRRGRPSEYGDDDTTYWIGELWHAMGRVHERLMKAEISNWLKHMKANEGPRVETRLKLLKMSASTMERLLREYKKDFFKSHFSATRRSRFKGMESVVPQRPLNFSIKCSGYLEGDTVAHCGSKLSGLHAWTLNTVDHYTHWCEQQAVMGKTAHAILLATIAIRARLPFSIRGYHHDGGTEFMNEILYEYFQQPEEFVLQTCGRAYKKNDQARVEQRNFTHVRQVFGYERIDSEELVELMNDIYNNELRQLNNFFTATQKLKSKTRKGSKYHRKYEVAMTPYQRVMVDASVSQIQKEKLKREYESLNPFELRKSLEKKLRNFEKRLNEKLSSTEITTDPSVGSPEKKAA